jgi:lycopene cyclase domain-containing protein
MLVLLLSGIVPFALSFYPPLKFYRNIKALLISIGSILIIFGGWDVFATYRGHWWFDDAGVYPIRLLNLPIEEILFFIVIPFCCIFTWEVIKFFRRED